MRSLEEVKSRANKLRKILSAFGCDLKHSEAIEVIAKIDGHADWNAYAAFIKKNLEIAELYLDEMIEAENSGDYEKWIQRREKQYLGNSNERGFRRDLEDIRDELGEYVSREYLGSTTGYENSPLGDRYPKAVRHLWRGIFDKNETLILRDRTANIGLTRKISNEAYRELTKIWGLISLAHTSALSEP